jgi:hypothetical protein
MLICPCAFKAPLLDWHVAKHNYIIVGAGV